MSVTRYRTRDGDMLDDICHRHYGRSGKVVELVLEANRHLAAIGPVYQAGLVIRLPEIPAATTAKIVRLWD